MAKRKNWNDSSKNKKTIGVITFHFVYNCGALLQTFALQTYLKRVGYDVGIINYVPWYHFNKYSPCVNLIYIGLKEAKLYKGVIRKIYHFIKGFLCDAANWQNRYKDKIVQHKKFMYFRKKYFNETKVYRNLKSLQKRPPIADIYIAGSDQIWNKRITDRKFDPAYFLKFGNGEVVKVSYAAGMKMDEFDEEADYLKQILNDFACISLREKEYFSKVNDILPQIKVRMDLDPTLLLDRKVYDAIATEVEDKEPYIVTYTMPSYSQRKTYQYANKLSEKTGLKILDICGDPQYLNKTIPDSKVVDPSEFLGYIKKADFVLTNSYHGTIFSIIYNKRFIAFPASETGNRLVDLLEELGLDNRLCYSTNIPVEEYTDRINYDLVEIKLDEYKKKSQDYLKSLKNL